MKFYDMLALVGSGVICYLESTIIPNHFMTLSSRRRPTSAQPCSDTLNNDYKYSYKNNFINHIRIN